MQCVLWDIKPIFDKLIDLDCCRCELAYKTKIKEPSANPNELENLKMLASVGSGKRLRILIMGGMYEVLLQHGYFIAHGLYDNIRHMLHRVFWFKGRAKNEPIYESEEIEAAIEEKMKMAKNKSEFWLSGKIELSSGNLIKWKQGKVSMHATFGVRGKSDLNRGYPTELRPLPPDLSTIVFVIHGNFFGFRY